MSIEQAKVGNGPRNFFQFFPKPGISSKVNYILDKFFGVWMPGLINHPAHRAFLNFVYGAHNPNIATLGITTARKVTLAITPISYVM